MLGIFQWHILEISNGAFLENGGMDPWQTVLTSLLEDQSSKNLHKLLKQLPITPGPAYLTLFSALSGQLHMCT